MKTKRNKRKSKQVKRFKPADVRFRGKREVTLQQEAAARSRYH